MNSSRQQNIQEGVSLVDIKRVLELTKDFDLLRDSERCIGLSQHYFQSILSYFKLNFNGLYASPSLKGDFKTMTLDEVKALEEAHTPLNELGLFQHVFGKLAYQNLLTMIDFLLDHKNSITVSQKKTPRLANKKNSSVSQKKTHRAINENNTATTHTNNVNTTQDIIHVTLVDLKKVLVQDVNCRRNLTAIRHSSQCIEISPYFFESILKKFTLSFDDFKKMSLKKVRALPNANTSLFNLGIFNKTQYPMICYHKFSKKIDALLKEISNSETTDKVISIPSSEEKSSPDKDFEDFLDTRSDLDIPFEKFFENSGTDLNQNPFDFISPLGLPSQLGFFSETISGTISETISETNSVNSLKRSTEDDETPSAKRFKTFSE